MPAQTPHGQVIRRNNDRAVGGGEEGVAGEQAEQTQDDEDC